MKAYKYLLKLNVLCILASFLASQGEGFKLDLEDDVLFVQFYDFATKHGRQYRFNSSELLYRFQVYKDSAKRADQMNCPSERNDKCDTVFGINKFADFTPGEFKAKYLSGLKHPRPTLKFGTKFYAPRKFQPHVDLNTLPRSVDWRNKSVLSPIIDQKGCGACWAISTVETMEAMSVIENQTKSVNRLSIQEVIDCDEENKGCEGGDICQAATWAKSHGIVSAKYYPFAFKTGTCQKVPASAAQVKVSNFDCSGFIGNENKILEILANHGPVMAAVDASTWHNYVGGIIRFHCSGDINHAVQIVGYNLEGEVPYYIIRNSWGADFGEKGYLYLKIGKNLCGIASEVVKLSVSATV